MCLPVPVAIHKCIQLLYLCLGNAFGRVQLVRICHFYAVGVYMQRVGNP